MNKMSNYAKNIEFIRIDINGLMGRSKRSQRKAGTQLELSDDELTVSGGHDGVTMFGSYRTVLSYQHWSCCFLKPAGRTWQQDALHNTDASLALTQHSPELGMENQPEPAQGRAEVPDPVAHQRPAVM